MFKRLGNSLSPSFRVKYSPSLCKTLVKNRKIHNLDRIEEVTNYPTEILSDITLKQSAEHCKNYSYAVVGSSYAALAAIGADVVLPLLDSFAASGDVMASANIEFDLSSVPMGEAVTVKWRGKPLFIRHRTPAEIESADSVPLSQLNDPEEDDVRTKRKDFIILVGICTHLGCVPINGQGRFGGWFCPCHGSHYDTSGRIRAGPAPKNLEVPPYYFMDDNRILVGLSEPPEQ